ncbi:uncharacterized protein [Euphorbia lathyris]|uniref:uncharacterized protein isoform X2 n=1 Tax=Euphorbia lathyris TaxID=212925 RepID=UPI003313CD7C
MDWDLWSAPYDPDVIEEDALKEKCCIQVLRILITKADTEIDELEQDLIFLQSELAWIENEEWSEIGYNALTQKINSLDTSMKSLRNEDVEVHLLTHTQPVERLHEILQALLSNYLQPANAGVKDCSCHSLQVEAGFSVEVIKSNSSCPISIEKAKGSRSGFNSKEQKEMQNLSSNCEDKGRHNAEKLEIQPTNVGVNNAMSDASKHADDSSNMMNKLSNSDSSIASGDFEEHSSISTAGLISCSPVNPMVIKTDAGEKDVDFGENVTAEELACANELNENGNADPGLGMSSDPGNQDGLSDLTLNGKNEPTAEEIKVAASEIVTSLDSSVTTERKEKNPVQILKVEAALTEKENCALTLLLEQQDKKGNNVVKVEPMEEDKTIPEVEMSVISTHEKLDSNLPQNSPQDLQKEKMKGSMNTKPLNIHEVGISKLVVDSSSSFIMKGKKRQKSVARTSTNPEWKSIKKEVGENGDEKSTLKKTKSLNTPLNSEVKRGTGESSNKDALALVEPIPPLPEMEKLRVPELRKLARQHRLSKYSQLNKKELIQQLLAYRNRGT